ncbi:VPS33B-interacting protein [Danaus plexippus plexippus]|uniref:VPS33B-interacting protein n=1 Tax=Danaus plexippus plexippus TaxID=278856 RepID=A0A212F370_DANPL|nr:spermatogenesis-defective protein 39 homolog [Danaus plexippus plexippus]OWR48180.1 VPS33B-interacting protein [Danaus plexippus plexippus]
MDDDDYWNTSETKAKAFSFDDDVLSTREILAIGQKSHPGQSVDSVFTTLNDARTELLPISSLVSPKVLDLMILAQSGRDPNNIKDSEQTLAITLKRIILGRSFSLHQYKSLRNKTELLDGTISIGDGNAILTVVLYLIQTLNKKLVYELLSARPLALNHYISFLQTEGKITELTDLLTMLGRSSEAAVFQFQHIVKTQGNSIDGLLRKVNNLLSNHFNQPGMDAHQNKMVADYIKLLEWQKCSSIPELYNASALSCLLHCVTHHWTEGAGNMMSPLTLCQRQQVTPLQYDWVVLNIHANTNKWDVVESLFTKKDWLGRTTVSSHIPIETLISRLSELKASVQIIATCLNKLTNTEDRLRLAQKYKVS